MTCSWKEAPATGRNTCAGRRVSNEESNMSLKNKFATQVEQGDATQLLNAVACAGSGNFTNTVIFHTANCRYLNLFLYVNPAAASNQVALLPIGSPLTVQPAATAAASWFPLPASN